MIHIAAAHGKARRRGRQPRLLGLAGAVLLFSVCCENGDDPPAASADPPGPRRTTSAETTGSPTPAPGLLLPNLQSLPAEDVHIRPAEGGGRELRFAAALANVGEGPLVLTPDGKALCPAGERHASQVVYYDGPAESGGDRDGQFDAEQDTGTEVFPAGCMLDHPTHDHWHFDAMASYTLTRAGEDTPVVAEDKVSFCLRDNRQLPQPVPPVPQQYKDCDRLEVQGISPGWADVYDADLPGQALRLPDDLADGMFCLRLSADPFELLRETDETDNSSVIGIEITGDEVALASDERC